MTDYTIKAEDIKGICELCQHLNNIDLCEKCRYQPLGEGMEDLWCYRDGLAVQQVPEGFKDGVEYVIQREEMLVVIKSGYTVQLRCPYSQGGCTLSCPRCYEEPVHETRFGPSISEGDGRIKGTRLVTCGQTFHNRKEKQ